MIVKAEGYKQLYELPAFHKETAIITDEVDIMLALFPSSNVIHEVNFNSLYMDKVGFDPKKVKILVNPEKFYLAIINTDKKYKNDHYNEILNIQFSNNDAFYYCMGEVIYKMKIEITLQSIGKIKLLYR